MTTTVASRTTALLRSAAAALALVPAVHVVAQTTYNVPTGASLTPFIAAAAPGDTLQLGTEHPPFVLNKGLHIVGVAGNTWIRGASGNTTTSVNVPLGQRASLASLQFAADWSASYPFAPPSPFVNVQGDVVVEECNCYFIRGGTFTVAGGTVLFRQCILQASMGGSGLTVTGGFCSISQTTVTGGGGGQYYMVGSFVAGPGVAQASGRLSIDACSVTGGDGGSMYGQPMPPAPALRVQGGFCDVVDSVLTGGSAGGAAIESTGQCGYARCTFSGAVSGTALSTPGLVGLRASGALQLGVSVTLTATAGSSQQPLVIAASLQSGVALHPLAVQPVLGGGAGLVPLTFVAAPAAGAFVSAVLAVPNVVALRGTGVLCQAFQWQTGLVQASSFVGGAVR